MDEDKIILKEKIYLEKGPSKLWMTVKPEAAMCGWSTSSRSLKWTKTGKPACFHNSKKNNGYIFFLSFDVFLWFTLYQVMNIKKIHIYSYAVLT